MFDPDIRITDFNYDLPAERVAQFPLPDRDASNLLVYRHGHISHDTFVNIGSYLPEDPLLVFNDTRVIHARLLFRKPTGGQIEIFCLEPLTPVAEIQEAFRQHGRVTWKCLVGNLKRWKTGPLQLDFAGGDSTCSLTAERIRDLHDGCFEIAFQWDAPEKTFTEVLEHAGRIPLPPYINRPAGPGDDDRYQTVYAHSEGSVAAPTAGLHFTQPLLDNLEKQGISTTRVTLHVGIGTFRPVTAASLLDHVMHHERIVVSREALQHLVSHGSRPVIAVGTTSARTLESLYWLGVKVIRNGGNPFIPEVNQWDPYADDTEVRPVEARDALTALLSHLETNCLDTLSAETRLIIIPGYRYRIVSGLITNFHMPQSTLLLLVAALVGSDWKKAYDYAMGHGFRFLSYGDSCLFLSNPENDRNEPGC